MLEAKAKKAKGHPKDGKKKRKEEQEAANGGGEAAHAAEEAAPQAGVGTKAAKKRRSVAGKQAAEEPAAAAPLQSSGRNYTCSMAVPGSLVAGATGSGGGNRAGNAAAAAAAVARQLASAAFAGCLDEVVVYEDEPAASASGSGGATSVSQGAALLAQALQYLETPPYLRAALCAPRLLHPALHAALLALGPLPHPPHHPKQTDWLPFREGVVLKSSSNNGSSTAAGTAAPSGTGHSFVDVGLDRMAYVPMHLPLGARVTLSLGAQPTAQFVPAYSETMITAEVVPAITPRVKHGMYWGFTVRLASSLHDVFKGCPYKSGYDLTIGTSASGVEREHADLVLPRYSHLLLAFGGAHKGLAAIMEQEEALAHKSPEDLFGMYLNVCPGQGCASLRTEDAVLMALGYLRPALIKFGGNVGQPTK